MECVCPALRARCLAEVLAAWSGRQLRPREIGARLGISPAAAETLVKALEAEGVIRLLPFLGARRRPLLYVRNRYDDQVESFKGFCIDLIIPQIARAYPDCRFSWWKTGRVRKVDLIATAGQQSIGFCFCESICVQRRRWLPLQACLRHGLIQKGYVVHRGEQVYTLGRGIKAVPLGAWSTL